MRVLQVQELHYVKSGWVYFICAWMPYALRFRIARFNLICSITASPPGVDSDWKQSICSHMFADQDKYCDNQPAMLSIWHLRSFITFSVIGELSLIFHEELCNSAMCIQKHNFYIKKVLAWWLHWNRKMLYLKILFSIFFVVCSK